MQERTSVREREMQDITTRRIRERERERESKTVRECQRKIDGDSSKAIIKNMTSNTN